MIISGNIHRFLAGGVTFRMLMAAIFSHELWTMLRESFTRCEFAG